MNAFELLNHTRTETFLVIRINTHATCHNLSFSKTNIGQFQEISIPNHGRLRYFNPRMPSEIPKYITPLALRIPNAVTPPPSPSEFAFFHQALWKYLFDSVQHLHDQTSRNLHAFPSPPKYSKNEKKRERTAYFGS